MGRNKTNILLIPIAFLLLSSFTLLDDRFKETKKDDSTIILNSIYNVYNKIDLVKIDFKERVYIPFLEKWSEFTGTGIYKMETYYFNINIENKTRDLYISNGKLLFVESTIEGKRETQTFPFKEDSLFYLIPSKKKWEFFDKKIYKNSDREILIVLIPKEKEFEFKRAEFILNSKNLKLKEVSFIGRDDRILYFKIKNVTYPKITEKEIKKLFRL
jgi:hypothetical protein